MIKLKRTLFLFFLVVASVGYCLADAISDFTSSKSITPASTAVLVKDLRTGRILAAHNQDASLIPASILKSVSVATLLDKVGNNFRYVTPVYLTGVQKDGTLSGNIIVEAAGDPSVNSDYAYGSEDLIKEITDALLKAKISKIEGSVIIDESDFPGPAINPSWAKGDLPNAYGTGTHGFNFEDNTIGKKSVADPSGVFRTKLAAALQKAGIALGKSPAETDKNKRLLVSHKSATIDELMRSCMMRSDNQFAEAFLRLTGLKYGGSGSVKKGAEQEIKFWERKRANTDSVIIVDGSGLSRSNRVTARFMADVLTQMSGNPYYASFFPLAGQEGTLKHLLADTRLEGYVAMKTGSMTGIQCYAGYKLDDDYEPTHVIVVIMNALKDRTQARKEVEKLLLSVFPQS